MMPEAPRPTAPVATVRADARIPALDGLRAIASLTVVFYHFFPHIARDLDAPFGVLQRLPRHGGEGVNLFFVLSGFLISGILVNARESTRYFSTFYIRRAFRIFPLYYLVLGTYVVALGVAGPGGAALGRLLDPQLPLWTYVLYVQNVAMALASSYGATWMAGSWSLAIEEQFYLTLPTIVRYVNDRTLARLAAATVVGSLLLRGAVQKFQFLPEMANKMLLPMAVDSLAIGVLVMLALRYYGPWIAERRRPLGWLAVVCLAGWWIYPLVPNPQAIRMFFLDASATNVMCGVVLLYLLVAADGWLGRFLSRPTMRLLGNMAYSTYLVHPIFLCLSFQWLRHADPLLRTTADLLPLAIAAVTTLVVSYGSWTLFESKLVTLGHKWQYAGGAPKRSVQAMPQPAPTSR